MLILLSIIFKRCIQFVLSQQIYSLEEKYLQLQRSLICEIKPCANEVQQYVYGQETFGNMAGVPFVLSCIYVVKQSYQVFYDPNGQSNSIVASITQGVTAAVTLTQTANYTFNVINANTIISQQFNLDVWYQIIITESIIQVCNHLTCFSTQHNQTITQNTKFSILNLPSTNTNQLITIVYDIFYQFYQYACCIIMYKGIRYPNINQITFYNTRFPEVVVNLNVQEKIQSKITADYSDYQYIAKLGDIFDYDQYDPYLVDDSLLFNGTQYLQINQITLNNQYSFEFRIKQSDQFTSNIILLNYYIPQSNLQIYLFLNGSIITYKLNNQYQQFQLLNSVYIHFFIGIKQFLEKSVNLQQIYFIQISDINVLQILTQNISGYCDFNTGFGHLNIGSKNNQFQQGEQFQLYHFRYYQGFFYDDQQVMQINCKIYLNDRCIICNPGYKLQDDHRCVLVCDSSYYETIFVGSHNQCIRKCHTKCATCSSTDPATCLTCNQIRNTPPSCTCSNQYFDDYVTPKCRSKIITTIEYFADPTTQTGHVVAQCNQVYLYPINLNVYYQQKYLTIPKVAISLIGQSFDFATYYYYTYYHLDFYNEAYFTISYQCSVSNQKYVFNWISTLGDNLLKQQYFSDKIFIWAGNYTLTQQALVYSQQNVNPIYQVNGWVFNYVNSNFQIKQQVLSPTQISIFSDIQIFNGFQSYNYFYTLYNTYSISSSTFDTQLDDQPKSVKHFIVQRGFYVQSISFYRYVNQTRTNNYFKIKQQFNQSMEIYDWIVILASIKCQNVNGPCDFYSYYNSQCNLQFPFCAYISEGYYVTSTFIYAQCDANCKTCYSQPTNCTSCYTDYFISSSDIASHTSFCQHSCDKTCLTCSTTNYRVCTSCGQNSILTSSQCICNDGYYFDGAYTYQCQKCPKLCLTCDDKNQCLSCDSSKILNGITCSCPQGQYYDINMECQKCSPICKTCVSNPTCTSCIDTLQVLLNGQCFCPDGYYIDNTFKCQLCQLPCVQCLDQVSCLSCEQDKVLFNYKCICDQNKYLDQNNQCQNCNQQCKTCYGPLQNQCLSCISERVLTLTNQCLCDIGYYLMNDQCYQCSYYCKECEQASTCKSCPTLRYLNDQNICVCQKGYYENQNQSCEPCPNNCVQCTNHAICTECIINQTLQDGKCVCSKGFYYKSGLCESCDSQLGIFQQECNYKNCSDNTWTPAEECDDGNRIDNDGCTNCLIDKNYQCYNKLKQPSICYKCGINCQSCDYQENQIRCASCIDGYYLKNNVCLQCDQQCKTCSQFSKCDTCKVENTQPDEFQRCLTCQQGMYEYQGQCQSKCGDGIKTEDEECDDGNIVAADGCNDQCYIEDSFICIVQQSKSQCFYYEKPKLKINNIIKITQAQYVISIISNQKIYYSQLRAQITLKDDEQYTFTYKVNGSLTQTNLAILQLNITINFTLSFKRKLFIIQIDGNISNQFGQTLNQTQIEQVFQNVQILSDQEQAISKQGSEIANILFYLTVGLTILQFILSGSSPVSLMLRTQNYLQYMIYIKIDYPSNVAMLFSQFANSNILQYFDITLPIVGQFGFDINFNAQCNKIYILNNYQVNTSFILNTMPILSTIIQGYLFIKITQFIVQILNAVILYEHLGQSHFQTKLYQILSRCQIFALKSINEFKQSGTKEILLISQYQLSFAFFIRLKTIDYNSYYDITELALSCIFYFTCLNYLLDSQAQIKQFGKSKKSIINNHNQLRLLNGVVYVFCIVFLDEFQLQQMLIVSTQSLIMLWILVQNKRLQKIQSIV